MKITTCILPAFLNFLLLVVIGQKAFGASNQVANSADILIQIIDSMDDSTNDLFRIAVIYKSLKDVTPAAKEPVADFVAVAFLKQKRADYYDRISSSLKRKSIIEKEGKMPCPKCGGLGYIQSTCEECRGSGSCRDCQNSGTRLVRSFNGAASEIPCGHCIRSGNCPKCKGVGCFRPVCRACSGKKTLWSPELINQIYEQYFARAKSELLRPKIFESLVIIHGDRSVGSGFVISRSGRKYVASNAHVFIGNTNIDLVAISGLKLPYKHILAAKDRDFILFEIDSADDSMPALPLVTRREDFQNGRFISIYGNSQGADVATVLLGKVLGVGPVLIETDAEFVAGNSGSPVLSGGTVWGIATFATKFNNDWVSDGTRFSKVRRFATRIDNMSDSDFDTVNMAEYLSQVTFLTDAETAVGNVVADIDRSGVFTALTKCDTNLLASSTRNLSSVAKWSLFMMTERATELAAVCSAILQARDRLESAKVEEERLTKNASEKSGEIRGVIDGLLSEQAKGRYGLAYWVDPSLARMLFAPVTWDVVEFRSSGSSGTALVRVESSTQGGFPIRKLWDFGLRYTSKGWRVSHIAAH